MEQNFDPAAQNQPLARLPNGPIIIGAIFVLIIIACASYYYFLKPDDNTKDYASPVIQEQSTESPSPSVSASPNDGNGQELADATITTDNAKAQQIMEGFGSTYQTLVYGGSLGDALTQSQRTRALDALFKQVKLTTGQVPAIFEAPFSSTLSNFFPNQANDNNDPLDLNPHGFTSILGDTFKQKVIDIAGSVFNLYPDVRISTTTKSSWLSHIQGSDYERFLDETAEQVLAGITYWKTTYGSEPTYAMLFNEPLSGNVELGHASNQTLVDIIKRAGKRVRAAGFSKVKFIAPAEETEIKSLNAAKAILADPEARQYLGVISYHPYPYLSTYSWPPNILETSGKGQPDQSKIAVRNQLRNLAKQYGIKLFMTEVSSGPAAQSKPINPLSYDVFRARAIHIHDELMYANASAFFGMNSMWDAKSQKDHFKGRGFEDDLFASEGDVVLIDNVADKIYITGMGRAIGHYARWVNKGAVRIEATSTDPLIQVTAFRDDRQKQMIWVVINNATSEKTLKFDVRGFSLGGSLSAEQSTTAAYWQKLPVFQTNSSGSFTIKLPPESVITIIGQAVK